MSLSATHSFIQDGRGSGPALCPPTRSEWESGATGPKASASQTQPHNLPILPPLLANQRHDNISTLPFHTPLLCYNGPDWTGLHPQPPVCTAIPEHSLFQWPSPASQGDQAQSDTSTARPPASPAPHTPHRTAPHRTNYQDCYVERSLRQSGALEQKGATMWWRWVAAEWRGHGDLWSMTNERQGEACVLVGITGLLKRLLSSHCLIREWYTYVLIHRYEMCGVRCKLKVS